MVTTVKEAMTAENAGVDVIVAQGSEAGGHRNTFDIEEHSFNIYGGLHKG